MDDQADSEKLTRMAQRSLAIRSAPYVRLIKRAFLGPGNPKSASYCEEVLCPEETQFTQPPIYLPGQLDRLTGATEHQPLAAEIASMLATEYKHAATIAYHIKDAVLFNGSVYAGNLRHFISDKALFGSSKPYHLKVAGLASTNVGSRYFGHWLRDDCVQYLLAEKIGTPICVKNHPAYEHKARYATYLDQDWTPTDRAYVDDLVIYQDFAQNSLKRQRYKLLAGKIAAKFPLPTKHRGLVYLRRGGTGVSRVIQNEALLLKALVSIGFVVVDVATDDLDLIFQSLSQARLVVSMEGSQISHCTFSLAENCGLVVLQPSDRFTAVHRHWTERVGIHFGFVVGTAGDSGYQFSTNEVLRTIEMMQEAIDLRSSVTA